MYELVLCEFFSGFVQALTRPKKKRQIKGAKSVTFSEPQQRLVHSTLKPQSPFFHKHIYCVLAFLSLGNVEPWIALIKVNTSENIV